MIVTVFTKKIAYHVSKKENVFIRYSSSDDLTLYWPYSSINWALSFPTLQMSMNKDIHCTLGCLLEEKENKGRTNMKFIIFYNWRSLTGNHTTISCIVENNHLEVFFLLDPYDFDMCFTNRHHMLVPCHFSSLNL